MRDQSIYYSMPFQNIKRSYIHQLCFSNSCDLYVLCHEDDGGGRGASKSVTIYRLRPGLDISIESSTGLGRQSVLELKDRRFSTQI